MTVNAARLFCLVWRVRTLVCDDQNTVHTQLFSPLACCRVLHVCALFELTEFCFVFRFVFFATFLNFTSRIERLHYCYYCPDVWRLIAHFCSEYSRACPSTGVFMTRHVHLNVQLCALNRARVLLRVSICFEPFCWISRRESSGYAFAITAQMYEEF